MLSNFNDKLHKIALNTSLISKQLFAGNFTSLFKGSGINFKELRDYKIGDDIKSINWVASARFGKLLLKINEEERQQHIIFLIDISKSVEFGTTTKTKKDLIAEICFLIAFSAYKNNDKIAAVFFSDKVEKVIPLSNNRNNLFIIAKNLIDYKAISNGTNYRNILNYLNLVFAKDAIVFFISDFITNLECEKELSIAAKKFTIIAIKVSDIIEKNTKIISNAGIIKVLDEESGVINFFDTLNFVSMQEQNQMREEQFINILKKYHIRHINIDISNTYISKLKEFFDKYK